MCLLLLADVSALIGWCVCGRVDYVVSPCWVFDYILQTSQKINDRIIISEVVNFLRICSDQFKVYDVLDGREKCQVMKSTAIIWLNMGFVTENHTIA